MRGGYRGYSVGQATWSGPGDFSGRPDYSSGRWRAFTWPSAISSNPTERG